MVHASTAEPLDHLSLCIFFFSSRRRHTRCLSDWSSDVCSSDLGDQYQVILEVQDSERTKPGDLSLLYIRSDDGKTLVPLSALVTWEPSLGAQTVNHLNQFTSVTVFFNLKPEVAIGDATDFIGKAEKDIVPPTMRSEEHTSE